MSCSCCSKAFDDVHFRADVKECSQLKEELIYLHIAVHLETSRLYWHSPMPDTEQHLAYWAPT